MFTVRCAIFLNFSCCRKLPRQPGGHNEGIHPLKLPGKGRSLPNPLCGGSPIRLFVYNLFTVYELFTSCVLFTVYCLPIRGNLFTVYDLFTNSWDHKLFINMFISY